MMYYTHAILAILISIILKTDPLLLIIGALLPDIDHPCSLIGRACKRISKHLTHRGLTHSLIFTLASMIIPCIGIGVASHVLLDLLSNNGVKLFYPSVKRYVLFSAPFTTGKHDTIISLALIGGIICL